MAWIFQGNPNKFDIDDYLSRYSFIYWSTPTNQKDLKFGDRAFIWRAGAQPGVVAIGIIRELPTSRENVNTPEALGDDLWTNQQDEPTDIKVGIQVDEARLTPDEGMLQRYQLKEHPTLRKNRIITNPVGTVFRLKSDETDALMGLWKVGYTDIDEKNYSAMEGVAQLRSHYRRERSRKLINLKKEQYKKINGKLRCEICGLSFEEVYPKALGDDFIEAHHKIPLAQINQVIRTTLDDLLLVCSNCHRMIHRTKDCEENLELLLKHFGKLE
jgi:hypothetical protein